MNRLFKNIDGVGRRYRFQTSLPIVGDEEGLHLTSYQSASEHTAERIRDCLGEIPVLEICCGVGGTTVFLAQYLPHVYAVDKNPLRIEAAKINAETFGVLDKITFIVGDALDEDVLKQAKQSGVKAIVTDVEWRNDLTKSLLETTPHIQETIPSTPPLHQKLTELVTPNIIMHMAANTSKEELKAMANCEIEEMYLDGIVKFINVYFGPLIKSSDVTQYRLKS